VLRIGEITVSGPQRLRRAFPTWNLHEPNPDNAVETEQVIPVEK
jgi:hypothetical protein